MTPSYRCAADLFDSWQTDVLTGSGPVLWPCGAGELERFELGPGQVVLIGGAPGMGKTAFTMQCVVDALRLNSELRALVCNVEMTPAVLMDRQLSRLSGVDLTTIRHRRFESRHAERIDGGLSTLVTVADRLAMVDAPYDLANVAASADAFAADLLILDYIQRIPPPGDHADKRGGIDATMNYLRQFADVGLGVVVVSAVGRTRDKAGRSSYDAGGLNLASFKESGELEFGADSAWILVPTDKDDASKACLRCCKNRHGDPRDIPLTFDRSLQRFTPTEADGDRQGDDDADDGKDGPTRAELRKLWDDAPSDGTEPTGDHDAFDGKDWVPF